MAGEAQEAEAEPQAAAEPAGEQPAAETSPAEQPQAEAEPQPRPSRKPKSSRKPSSRAAAEAEAEPQADPSPARAASSGPSGDAIDLNSASFEQLRSANLSVTQATRVLAHRERRGGYSSVDDLDDVPGFPGDVLAEFKRRVKV